MDDKLVQPRFEIAGIRSGQPTSTYMSWVQVSMSTTSHDLYVLTATVPTAGMNRGTSNQGNAVVTYTGMMVVVEAVSLGELLSAWNAVASGSGSADRKVVFPDVRRRG